MKKLQELKAEIKAQETEIIEMTIDSIGGNLKSLSEEVKLTRALLYDELRERGVNKEDNGIINI